MANAKSSRRSVKLKEKWLRAFSAEAMRIRSDETLRDVVADRSPDHVVDSLRRDASCSKRAVVTRPAISGEVRVLNAKPEAALRTLKELVPEPESAFHDHACVTRATRSCGWREWRRGRRELSQAVRRSQFFFAATVVGEW